MASQTSLPSNLMSTACRGVILFLIGVGFALVLNILQLQNKVVVFEETLSGLLKSTVWVPVTCGVGTVLLGMLYPCIDNKLGQPHTFKREWSSVMKCVLFYIGLNHAASALEMNNVLLALFLSVMSLALWWLYDRSRSGFALSAVVTVLATCVTQILVYHRVFSYPEPDFFYCRSWLPSMYFASGVTVGNIGRQLALHYESDGRPAKLHRD